MTAQGKEIINRIKGLRKTPYGDYLYRDDLRLIISKVMGYKYYTFFGGDHSFDYEKVEVIEKNMLDKNIIKFSKNGNMFKLIYKG